jgi:hypothetical protein
MAGSKTDALEQRLLDHLFKGGGTPALTALSTVYVASLPPCRLTPQLVPK